MDPALQRPAELETGLIPTDNAMGVMTTEVSPAGEAFIALAAHATRPLLEIGAAYGNSTLPALAAGATILANDLSPTELAVLAASTPEADRKHLVLLPARFPDELHLADESLDGVLCSQVLHFFDGPAVERAFQTVYRWLAPGGAFFVVVMTPSLSYYSKLRPAYEQRAAAGIRWPGIFDPNSVAPDDWKGRVPDRINLFEKDTLQRTAEETGFYVETLDYFCFKNYPDRHRTDGREYLTMTARKLV